MNAAPALAPRKPYVPRAVAVNDGAAWSVPTAYRGDRRFRIASLPDWRHWRDPLPSVAEARAFATYVRRSLRETGLMLPCSAEVALEIVEAVDALAAADQRAAVEPIRRAVSIAARGRLDPALWCDVRQELAALVADNDDESDNLDACSLTRARNMVADEIDREAKHRDACKNDKPRQARRGKNWRPTWYPPHKDAARFAPLAIPEARVMHCKPVVHRTNGVEVAVAESIDGRRGVRGLTKIDLEFFWEDVHAWCRRQLGRPWLAAGEMTPRELTDVQVDGRHLTPDEATSIRLLSMPACPEGLGVTSQTTPKDVFDRVYETVKKAFQRAALKNRRTCPPTVAPIGDLLVRGQGSEQ